MTDMQDGDDLPCVIHLVDHAIITDSDPPSITSCQLQATVRARVFGERSDGVANALVVPDGKAREFPLRRAEYGEGIRH